jgi:hypothetical protein
MAGHPSRDKLRSELVRQKLPRAYIERLLSELDDHFEDLLEERSTSMGAARKLQTEAGQSEDSRQRLGEPAQLALFAGDHYHARSFWGRHPIVTFVLGPLPLLVMCWIVTAFVVMWAGVGAAYVGDHWFGQAPDTWQLQDHLWVQASIMVLATWVVIVFPPLGIAGLLCRIARRNVVDWRWPVVGCTLIAIIAGFVSVAYRLALSPHEGQINLGLNCTYTAHWLLVSYLPKFAAALGIGLLLVKRAQVQLERVQSTADA